MIRFAGFLFALLLAAPVAAAEQIRAFEVEIFLEPDGAFLVEETIDYDFGSEQRHGIYREIPIRYPRDFEADYRIDVDVIEVTDGAGSKQSRRIRTEGRLLNVRIGDADRTVTGRKTYRLRYRVERATQFFEEHDEVYWNVTGDAWRVPIQRAQVRLHLPIDPEGTEVQLGCYTGPRGSTASNCTQLREASSVSFATVGLGPGEGLSVVVGLPKGALVEPTAFAKAWDRFLAWGGFWLLAPFATLLAMREIWVRKGRDRGRRDAIPVRYEPPAGLSPAEVGTLFDESADMEDLTSTILDLAIRGHLSIEELESTKFLFFSERDYRLEKKEGPDEVLRPHERMMLSGIFASGDVVDLSDLREKFYTKIPGLVSELYRELSREGGYFAASPRQVRGVTSGIAVAIMVAAFAGLAVQLLPLGAAIAVGLSGLIVLLFAKAMPRRTRRGRKAFEEIQGFQEFLGRVDKDRLERQGTRTVEQFEHALPYAIVLGVADAWADAFADIYTEPPDWYRSQRYGGGFYPRVFVGDIGRSMQTIGETFTSRPKSSGSGSSGFSSGGGFSGGGFGGGGGGSW